MSDVVSMESDVVSMEEYQNTFDALTQLLKDINLIRNFRRRFPVLFVVSSAVHSSCLLQG
jgi:hypothetical protein